MPVGFVKSGNFARGGAMHVNFVESGVKRDRQTKLKRSGHDDPETEKKERAKKKPSERGNKKEQRWVK